MHSLRTFSVHGILSAKMKKTEEKKKRKKPKKLIKMDNGERGQLTYQNLHPYHSVTKIGAGNKIEQLFYFDKVGLQFGLLNIVYVHGRN